MARAYGGVTKMALGDSLEESRLSHICEADLQTFISCIQGSMWEVELHTIPLFKLLPGLPSRIFFSSTFFLGGIFFFAAYERVVVDKTVQLSRLFCVVVCSWVAVLAAAREKVRVREEKMAGCLREDVVKDGESLEPCVGAELKLSL